MPADLRLTKPEMQMLFRLASSGYVQRTVRSETIRASLIHKLGVALKLPRREPARPTGGTS